MKTILATLIASVLSSQALAICSMNFNNEAQYWSAYLSSTATWGETVTVSAPDPKTLVARSDRGRSVDLQGSEGLKIVRALGKTFDLRRPNRQNVAAHLNRWVDDEKLNITYLYTNRDRRVDYLHIKGYAGDNSFGQVLTAGNLVEIAEISDGDIYGCTQLAHKSTVLKALNDGRVLEVKSNTDWGLGVLHEDGLADICYEGTAAGVRNVLYVLFKNADLVTDTGWVKSSYDENDRELETSVNIRQVEREIRVEVEYQYADLPPLSVNTRISPCNR